MPKQSAALTVNLVDQNKRFGKTEIGAMLQIVINEAAETATVKRAAATAASPAECQFGEGRSLTRKSRGRGSP